MTKNNRKAYKELSKNFWELKKKLQAQGQGLSTSSEIKEIAAKMVEIGSPVEKYWDFINKVANSEIMAKRERTEFEMLNERFWKAFDEFKAARGADVSNIDPTYSGGKTAMQNDWLDICEDNLRQIANQIVSHKEFTKESKYYEFITKFAV